MSCKSKEKMKRGLRRGCMRLRGAYVGIEGAEEEATFAITSDGKTFHLQGKDVEEREKWIRALENAIKNVAQRNVGYQSQTVPTILDFDNKISETDAYLQLLVDQIKTLSLKIEDLPKDEQEIMSATMLASHAYLDSVKQSIVLLTVAKSTFDACESSGRSLPVGIGQIVLPDEERIVNSSPEVSDERAFFEESLPQGLEVTTGSFPGSSLPLPEISYSSSEDEDFYDAYENTCETPTPMINEAESGVHREVLATESVNGTAISPLTTKDINIDAIYEEGDDEDNVSLESHGSVIAHLVSQVKYGMDLTKVALPTFILERRSLLEMYADFFAHPDIFLRIADFKSPRERMIQVVRWYLSAFHAGRRSEVAKKPYNPILGETFQCWWDVPDLNVDKSEPAKDGPVPWCSKQQLAFIAEQVSHHPPVSGFYAENPEKRISFNGHIWTKSKFLGLSICVVNIGEGVISVLDFDEEYTITFPSAYGRSILTVPWIELGGRVEIVCTKTGYSAVVEFLTKPFYGGKKHRIVCDLFQQGEKKSFLNIQGEWNGEMIGKWSDGRTEEFVNVKKLSIVKKRVRRISEQEEYESRRLWQEVTMGLKLNDIPRATGSKHALEDRQRNEAKQRAETGEKWVTKNFNKAGEGWTYKTPLKRRLHL
ncbi:hypothetical protein QYM36_002642 [Artemia franciscana]|uniref:Oxysterol-binding protein n=1 Tax=Artemia franciscana TaxID=6661 RepID=A0AA88LHS3_ARTSF|nr:hypothetical protein QYM36_002642 [Artemia franciscana]